MHLQCWTIYCYICHSSAFFLVSDRSGWNHPLREAPCRLNVDLFLERARLAPPSPLKSSHQYTASFYSLRDLSRFSSLSTLFLYFRFLNFIFFVLSVVSSFYYYPEAHATQRKLKLGASYDVHLLLFTIYAVEVGRKWRGWWIERDRRRRWPGAWTLVGEEPQLGNPNWACSKHEVCAGQILAKYTGGASPWRADACLGSAHARNYRGCWQIEAVNATQYCQGVPSKVHRV